MDPINAVREYYDRNTRRFLRWGKDEQTWNIHAAMWRTDTRSLAQAMHLANDLVREILQAGATRPARVIDLGCGVGSGLFYLGERIPEIAELVGISLSRQQVDIAEARRRNRVDSGRFLFIRGDFHEAASLTGPADFAYAIEAFGHSPAPGRFFREVARILRPGGRLVIIDDCLTEKGARPDCSPSERKWLDTYRDHWLYYGLLDTESIAILAGQAGLALTGDTDLTSWLDIRRPRDRMITALVKLIGPLMDRSCYLRSLKGGDAKQHCYLHGLTSYRLLVFEKSHQGD